MRRPEVRECQRSIHEYLAKNPPVKLASTNGKTPSPLSPTSSVCSQVRTNRCVAGNIFVERFNNIADYFVPRASTEFGFGDAALPNGASANALGVYASNRFLQLSGQLPRSVGAGRRAGYAWTSYRLVSITCNPFICFLTPDCNILVLICRVFHRSGSRIRTDHVTQLVGNGGHICEGRSAKVEERSDPRLLRHPRATNRATTKPAHRITKQMICTFPECSYGIVVRIRVEWFGAGVRYIFVQSRRLAPRTLFECRHDTNPPVSNEPKHITESNQNRHQKTNP